MNKKKGEKEKPIRKEELFGGYRGSIELKAISKIFTEDSIEERKKLYKKEMELLERIQTNHYIF